MWGERNKVYINMNKRFKAVVLTFLFAVLSSVVNIVLNLIYNKYIIQIYGSEVNGLIATLTQFISMFSVIEGGFTTAAIVAVYKPIMENENELLNNILYTAKQNFMKIGLIITTGSLCLGSIYIYFIDSPYSYGKTLVLMLICSVTTGLSLCYLSKYQILLYGNNKEYIYVFFALISKSLTWIISIILILNKVSVVSVYFINIIDILISGIMIKKYQAANYKHISFKGKYDRSLIKGTKDVFFQKIANTIFTSTDLILISVFIGLAASSIYNLYCQIFRAIFNLLASIVQAPFNSIGQIAHSEEKEAKLIPIFKIYQYTSMILSTILLTVTGVMILPFVYFYTKKFVDYNYIIPSLIILFFSQFFLQIINRPFGNLLNATGNFNRQNAQCAAAAVVNLVVSVAFIKVWELNSIIFGSCVGTLVILMTNIYIISKVFDDMSFFKIVKQIMLNYIVGIIAIYTSLKMYSLNYNIYLLVMVEVFSVCLIVLLANFLVFGEDAKVAIRYFIKQLPFKRNYINESSDK